MSELKQLFDSDDEKEKALYDRYFRKHYFEILAQGDKEDKKELFEWSRIVGYCPEEDSWAGERVGWDALEDE
jgi:hypothetical protein